MKTLLILFTLTFASLVFAESDEAYLRRVQGLGVEIPSGNEANPDDPNDIDDKNRNMNDPVATHDANGTCPYCDNVGKSAPDINRTKNTLNKPGSGSETTTSETKR